MVFTESADTPRASHHTNNDVLAIDDLRNYLPVIHHSYIHTIAILPDHFADSTRIQSLRTDTADNLHHVILCTFVNERPCTHD